MTEGLLLLLLVAGVFAAVGCFVLPPKPWGWVSAAALLTWFTAGMVVSDYSAISIVATLVAVWVIFALRKRLLHVRGGR